MMQPMSSIIAVLFLALAGISSVGANKVNLAWKGSARGQNSQVTAGQDIELIVYFLDAFDVAEAIPDEDLANGASNKVIVTFTYGDTVYTEEVDVSFGNSRYTFNEVVARTAKGELDVVVTTAMVTGSFNADADTTSTIAITVLPDVSHEILVTPSVTTTAVPAAPSFLVNLIDQFGNPSEDTTNIRMTLTGAIVGEFLVSSQQFATEAEFYLMDDFTVVDVVTGAFTFADNEVLAGTTADIEFTFGVPTKIGLTQPADGTVDQFHTVTLKLLDAYDNVVLHDGDAKVNFDVGSAATVVVNVALTQGVGDQAGVVLQLPGTYRATVDDFANLCNPGACTEASKTFEIAPGDPVEYYVVDPADGSPTDPTVPGSTDNTMDVTIQARDQFANVATTQEDDVTVTLSGSAKFASGDVAHITSGTGTVTIQDRVAEIITIGLIDSAGTNLECTSKQQVRIYWGAPVKFYINQPGTANIRSKLSVLVQARDANNNVVESESRDVTLSVSGDAEPATQVVDLVAGRATVDVIDNILETVTLALVDSSGTDLNVDSTRDVTFQKMDPPPIIEIKVDKTETVAGNAITITATVKNGANNNLVEQYMLETATLYAKVDATNVITEITIRMDDAAHLGVGIYPFTTSKAGKVTLWIDSDENLGVTESPKIDVNFLADVPAVFTIGVDQNAVVVDNSIIATISVEDANGNPTDVGDLEVDVLMTGTVTDTSLELPEVNPTRLVFGDGKASSITLSSQTTEGVTITMSNPLPITIDVEDTYAVQFTQGAFNRIFFVPTPSGIADNSHTIKLVAGDVFYNQVDDVSPEVSILVSDGVLSEAQLIIVQLTDGLGEVSISREYPCDISVSIVAFDHDGVSIDTSPTSEFQIAPGAAIEYLITDPGSGDPNDATAAGSVDNTVSVTVKAYDQFGNVATGEQRDLTMALSGSAEFQTGSGVMDIFNGVATIIIKDDVAEDVTMRLVDTGSTGLDVVSEVTITIYWGETTHFFIMEIPFPNPVINGFKEVQVEARDQHNNLVKVEQRDVTIVVDGQASASAVTEGSEPDPKEVVDLVNGVGNGYITSPVVGDVTITMEDSEGTGLTVSGLPGSSRTLPFLAVQDLDTKVDARTIVVTLTTAELNEIKKRKTMGTEALDSFITFGGNAFTDLADNEVAERTVPLKAIKYTPDVTPPTLKNFNLIQQDSVLNLVLFFSETVSAESITPALITLQSSTGAPTFERALTATTIDANHVDSDIITLVIADADVVAIRALFEIGTPGEIGTGLGRTRGETHLSMKRGAVLDMVNLENIAVDGENAKAVQSYSVDLISPVILGFTLDMDKEHVILTYSEAIAATTLDGSQLTLQNTADGSDLSFAVASDSHTVLSSTHVQVDLTKTYANTLKALDTIATGDSDTYLSVTIGLVKDIQGNLADPLETATGLQVTLHVPDGTLAELKFFDLDLSNSKLHLEFDEPVKGASVEPKEIIIQGSVDGTSGNSYTLTGGTPEDVFARVITIDLTYDDVTKLKHNTGLATSDTDTFLSTFQRNEQVVIFEVTVNGDILPSEIASDMANNKVKHVPKTTALSVRKYDGDIIATTVERFELNMETGFLFLTFVEPVNLDTADLTEVTLSNDQVGTVQMPLTTVKTAISETSSRSFEVKLNKVDLDEIKKLSLCEYTKNGADCHISYTDLFIDDNAGIDIRPRTLADGLPAAEYVADGSSPTVENFGKLDLNTGEVMISFSETVLVSSFDVMTLALQTGPGEPDTDFGLNKITFNVDGGIVRNKPTPATQITFDLHHDELNRLKEDSTICAIPSQCHLVLVATTVMDMAGNALVATALVQPGLPVVNMVVDDKPPTLLQYNLDMNGHTLTLSFSESVDGTTLKPTAIYIQPAEQGSTATPAVMLSGGNAPKARSDTIVIDLLGVDVAKLSARRLATSDTNTYIYFDTTLVKDCAYTPNVITAVEAAAAKDVELFEPDVTPPQLKKFNLDLDLALGLITLSFNEPVDPSTFDVTKITLQSEEIYNAATTTKYTLTGGSLTTATDLNPADYVFALNEIVLVLIEKDQTALKIDFGLAVSAGTTWMVVDSADDTLDTNGDFESANTMIKDASGNPVAPITNDDALEIANLKTDSRNPVVTDLKIDFDKKTLSVKFNDVVDASSFKASGVTIQNAAENPTASYTLQSGTGSAAVVGGSSVSSDDGYLMVIDLGALDELELNTIVGLATEDLSTYIHLTSTTFKDVNGLNMLAVIPAVKVSDFKDDITTPKLEHWDVDLTEETVTMVFSEAVNLAHFTPAELTFNGAADATVAKIPSFTLTDGTNQVLSEDQLTLTFNLVKDDLDEIKRIHSGTLGDDGAYIVSLLTYGSPPGQFSDSYVEITSGFIKDMFGVDAEPVLAEASKAVRTYTKDATPPELLWFMMDMNSRMLTLSFSETMRASTMDPALTFEASDGSTTRHMLDGGDTSTSVDGLTLYITLTQVDVNALNTLAMFTDKDTDTFLRVTPGFAQDMAENALAVTTAGDAIGASALNADTTLPTLDEAFIDLDTRMVSLRFSETVKKDSLLATTVTIQNAATLSTESKTLTGIRGASTYESVKYAQDWSANVAHAHDADLSYTGISFYLNDADFNIIMDNANLAAGEASTFIALEGGLAVGATTDAKGNPIATMATGLQVPTANYASDGATPVFLGFEIDMHLATVLLTFSETVDINEFHADMLYIQNEIFTSTSSANFRKLTGVRLNSVVTRPSLTTVLFTLNYDDLIWITQGPLVATAQDQTYIWLEQGAIKDVSGNLVDAVANGAAKMASDFEDDAVTPHLVNFHINREDEQLVLTFSETVLSDSLIVGRLTVQERGDIAGGLSRRLVDPQTATSSLNGPIITVSLGLSDMNYIKQFSKGTDTTHLSMVLGAVKDTFQLDVDQIEDTDAQLEGVGDANDKTRPTLDSFSLDLTSELLSLTFSEIVDVETFNADEITFVSEKAASPAHLWKLTTATPIITNPDTHTVSGLVMQYHMIFDVKLSVYDLNNLKRITSLATKSNAALSDTYISWTEDMISDLNPSPDSANKVVAHAKDAALKATAVGADATRPTVSSFAKLDLTAEKLYIICDETVKQQIVKVKQITLQNARLNPTASYTLTGGDISFPDPYPDVINYADYTKITVELTITDLNEIKRIDASTMFNLCTPDGANCNQDGTDCSVDCFLSVTETFVTDMNDNAVVAVPVTDASEVQVYTRDNTRPTFVEFSSLSLDSGSLSIVFDETIRMSTITYASINLHKSHDSNVKFQFSAGTMVSQDATTVTFTMSKDDLDRLKKDKLCTDTSACFIRMADSAFADMAGNDLVPVVVRGPSDFDLTERLKFHEDDKTDPTVLKFDLNLDDDTLTLYFDETVDIGSIDARAITLQGAADAPSEDSHTLLGGDVETSEDGLVAVIKIDPSDGGVIAGVTNLGRSDQDTYMTFTTALLQDMRSNNVQKRVNAGAGVETPLSVSKFTGDRTPPFLKEFASMDFSVNPATMTLVFSEAVETSTLILDKVFLIPQQSDRTDDYVKLTSSSVDYVYDLQGNTNKKTVVITLSLDDQRKVKFNKILAIDRDSTFVTLNYGAIEDKHEEKSDAVTETDEIGAMQVTVFKPDVTQAVLESCNLNMNLGILTLRFNDVIDTATMDASKVGIISDNAVDPFKAIYLTKGEIPKSDPDYTVVLTMTSAEDLNELKRYRAVGTGVANEISGNTYVRLQENAFMDANVPAKSTVANTIQCDDKFTPDTTDPELVKWDLNMDGLKNEGSMTLYFSETVDITTVDVTFFSFMNAATSSAEIISLTPSSRNLDGGTLQQTPTNTATEIDVTFSIADFDEIKRAAAVAVSAETSFVRLGTGFVMDMNNNPIVAIEDGASPGMQAAATPTCTLKPSAVDQTMACVVNTNGDGCVDILNCAFSRAVTGTFKIDATKPVFEQFDFNMNLEKGFLTLTFSETVQSSSLDLQTITIQSAENAPGSSFTLRGGEKIVAPDVNPTCTKDSTFECQPRGDNLGCLPASGCTFAAATGGTDATCNVDNTRVCALTADKTACDSAISGCVHADGVAATCGACSTTERLASCCDTLEHYIKLTIPDTHAIRSQTGLASTSLNTYVSLVAGTINDMNIIGEPLVPKILAVTKYSDDRKSPALVTLDVDMDALAFDLTFTQPVDVDTFDHAQVWFRACSVCSESDGSYRLTGRKSATLVETGGDGDFNSEGLIQVHIELTRFDSDQIKQIVGLNTVAGDTFIHIGSTVFKDYNLNLVEPTVYDAPFAVNGIFTPDSTIPALSSFDLDLTAETLTLSFSETIDPDTFDASGITLTPDTTVLAGSDRVHKLDFNSVNVIRAELPDVVVLTLTWEDLNELKRQTWLATSQGTSFVSLAQDMVRDMKGNAIDPVGYASAKPCNALGYARDATHPVLENYAIDMTTGLNGLEPPIVLTLTFSETVYLNSITATGGTGLTITDAQAATKQHAIDTVVVMTQDHNHIITLEVSGADLAGIKNVYGLARDRPSTWLSMTKQTITDTAGNTVIPFELNDGKQVAVAKYNIDVSEPVVNAFDLNINAGTITFHFSEDVSQQDLSPTHVVISNYKLGVAPTNTDVALQEYTLTGGDHLSSYGDSAVLTLTDDDLNAIKLVQTLAVSDTSTFLSIDGAVPGDAHTVGISHDSAGNAADKIHFSNAQTVNQFQEDITPPILDRFDYNAQSGVISMTFNEVVDVSEIDMTTVTFVNSAAGDGTSVHLGGTSTTTSSDGLIIVVTLDIVDANKIRYATDLATDEAVDTWIVFPLVCGRRRRSHGHDESDACSAGVMITDMNNKPVTPAVAGDSAKQVHTLTLDTTPPVLQTFGLDMNTGIITLSYDEVIDLSTVVPSEFTLINTRSTTFADNPIEFKLTEGVKTFVSSTEFTITLGVEDFNRIKALPLCSATATSPADESSDCYIIHSWESAKDTMGFWVEGLFPAEAVAVGDTPKTPATCGSIGTRAYQKDTIRPEIIAVGFESFDLNDGTLVIEFSETVDYKEFTPTSLSMQTSYEDPTSDPSMFSIELDSIATMSNDDHTIKISVTVSDKFLNTIKKTEDVCSVQRNCWLVALETLIVDMAGNALVPTLYTSSAGRRVASFTQDDTNPVLDTFDLDMDTDTLVLHFSETMKASSVKPKEITFQNVKTTTEQLYVLTGGDVVQIDGTSITINLIDVDAAAIRARNLASDTTNTFIAILNTAAEDMAREPNLMEEVTRADAKDVASFNADAHAPVLTHFSVDLDKPRGEITFSFNEPIDPNTFDATKITIQSEEAFNAATTKFHRLQGGELTTATDLDPTAFVYSLNEIVLIITEEDQTALKIDFDLAVTKDSTYMVVDSTDDNTMIKDAAGNRVTAIGNSAAKVITGDLTLDSRQAEVTDMKIDFDEKTLIIKFNDVVDATTFKASGVTIQNAAEDPTASYTLQSGTGSAAVVGGSSVSNDDGYFMTIDLGALDELELNTIVGLATEDLNTFVKLTSTAFKDVNGVNIVAVVPALKVSDFKDDITTPKLEHWDVDLTEETVTMVFSEAVNLAHFTPAELTFNGAADATAVVTVPSFTLTDGTNQALSEDQLTLTFNLVKDDLDEIKRTDGLLTYDGDSYVEITSGFIKDMFGVDAEPVLADASKAVRTYTKDATPPALVSFEVDMDTDDLILSFSEPIRTTTVHAALRVTLSDPSSDSAESHTLNDMGDSSTADQLTVTIGMTHADMGAIKVLNNLYKDKLHAALSLANNFATDMAGNGILVEIPAKKALVYRADVTQPKLLNFAVNMNQGTITVNFDEPMRASSFTVETPPILTLQGGKDILADPAAYQTHVVQSMTWDTATDGTQLILTIDADELNLIKAKEDLFSEKDKTYISFDSGMVTDMSTSNNQVVARLGSDGLKVAELGFQGDEIMPVLLSFELDMASEPGVLTLSFSETVDISEIDQTLITLQNGFNAQSTGLVDAVPFLHDGTVNTAVDSTEISITLHKTDFHELKLKRIGISDTTTWLVLGDGFVKDMAGGSSVALVDGVTAKKVKTGDCGGGAVALHSCLVLDNVDPRIDVFDVNMNDGTVDIHFTEPVDAASLDASQLRLQGKRKTGL